MAEEEVTPVSSEAPNTPPPAENDDRGGPSEGEECQNGAEGGAEEEAEEEPAAKPDGDEYPAQPTFFYFLLKFALGAVTFGVLLVAYWFRPRTCEGVCALDAIDDTGCGPSAPKALVYHRLAQFDNVDGAFLASVEEAARRKGFNLIDLAPSKSPDLRSLVSATEEHAALREAFTHMPWQLVVRGNHSLYIKEGLTTVPWSDIGLPRTRSLILLRNPLNNLRSWYDVGLREVSRELFEKTTGRKKESTSFEQCASDPKCRSAMGFHSACKSQTDLICGVACAGDSLSTQERISRAKSVLKSKTNLVGFVEDLPSFVSVLRKKYPTYFEFASVSSLTEGTEGSSDFGEISGILDDLCTEDLAVFAEAVRIFKEVAQGCGVDNVTAPEVVVEREKKAESRGRFFFSW